MGVDRSADLDLARCPLCGEANQCAMAADPEAESCWCVDEKFPADLLARVPERAARLVCVCRRCAQEHRESAGEALALNGDMSQRVALRSSALDWQPSPSRTVWRKRLHLVGGAESGQVTSVVRYEKGASFAAHGHPDGEEILVLEGVFSDEHGDWPAGSYLLNPEGFRHAPFSEPGCLLFVKLRQYAGEGRRHVALCTRDLAWAPGACPGVEQKILYADPAFPDVTRLERWAPGTTARLPARAEGAELFALEGSLEDAAESFDALSWLRIPVGETREIFTREGCLLYLKTGALEALRSTA